MSQTIKNLLKPKTIPASQNNTNYAYAGFWIRVMAAIVDCLLYIVIVYPIGYLIYGNEYFTTNNLYLGITDFVIATLIPIIATLYMWVVYTATPGKLLFRISILDEKTGQNISPQQAIIRYLVSLLSFAILLLGIIWIAFDKKKQGWHDKIAKTVVVKEL